MAGAACTRVRRVTPSHARRLPSQPSQPLLQEVQLRLREAISPVTTEALEVRCTLWHDVHTC